ncbi:hypothetical protein H4R26_003606 [Coemansia thaxteri]|uniref:Uncharacterized protein n=1 Tax=Coemansia thaxteri TaxID=2663907 RepID=A0A9W8BHQ4_9FUNG|nr:hypothetical protein H4R26_003606 [Coemansia thaxteri]KAJ2482383.1 hypothetical protein EV174_003220 [Coemansia sp. RSA 2320]
MGHNRRTAPRVLDEHAFTSRVRQIVQRDFFPGVQQGSRRAAAPAETLGGFLQRHTSEDNARFRRLVDGEARRRDDRHSRMYGAHAGRRRCALLLEPAGERPCRVAADSRVIVHRNTRLPDQAQAEGEDEESASDGEEAAATPVIGGFRMLREPGSGGGGGFRLAAPSPRELAALRLAKRAAPQRPARQAPDALSPAARRLLLHAGRTPQQPRPAR